MLKHATEMHNEAVTVGLFASQTSAVSNYTKIAFRYPCLIFLTATVMRAVEWQWWGCGGRHRPNVDPDITGS